MSEAEKRQLDAFRTMPDHPATVRKDLPQEVQAYINAIEMELYDIKQDGVALKALIASGAGALFNYFGMLQPTSWSYAGCLVLLIFPWIVYRRRSKKNADEFLPLDPDPDALSPTDEAIRREWELEYLFASRSRDALVSQRLDEE